MTFSFSGLPSDLMSSDKTTTRRLKTDNVQTGFYEGRFFRTFCECDVPSGQSRFIKAFVPINVILWNLKITLHSSAIRTRTFINATETAAFNVILPSIRKNNMTACPVYVPQIIFSQGGTINTATGTIIDSNRIYAQAQPNRLATVGAVPFDERGAAPANYYFSLENIDGATALIDISFIWEEKPCQ
jgi:hypothetical protein